MMTKPGHCPPAKGRSSCPVEVAGIAGSTVHWQRPIKPFCRQVLHELPETFICQG